MNYYNPYQNLLWLAAMNVLKGEDEHSRIYPAMEGYVYVGAVQASMWLLTGARSASIENYRHLATPLANARRTRGIFGRVPRDSLRP